MRTTWFRTLLAVFLVAFLAVGCGDDDDSGNAPGDDAVTTSSDTSVAGTAPDAARDEDETGTAGMEGVTEEDNPCVTELTVQGTAEEAGVLDIQTAFAEETGEGTLRLAFASFDYTSGAQGGPGTDEVDPDVPEGEFLYVIDLQLDDPSASFQASSVFMTEGSETTVEEGTADQATVAGTITSQALWQGPEQDQLSDTYVEILEAEEGEICGAIGADAAELTESSTVTGRFVAEMR